MSYKSKESKTIECKGCGESTTVGHDTVSVTCWRCVMHQMSCSQKGETKNK